VLYNCKYQPGEKYCQRCNAKFANRAKKGHQPAGSTKAPATAPEKPQAPSKPKAKSAAPVPPPAPPILNIANISAAPTRSSARLVFSLPIPAGTTALELMDLLRSVPSTAVVEW
jgi:hypothetical protein